MHFAAEPFLRMKSVEDIWKKICRLWVFVYMGSPSFIAVDQGSAYVRKEMCETLSAAGVMVEEVLVDKPLSTVEKYHAQKRCSYMKIQSSLDTWDTSDEECLHMAVYAVYSAIGPKGLCTMLLVFGVLPQTSRTHPSPTKLQRQQDP